MNFYKMCKSVQVLFWLHARLMSRNSKLQNRCTAHFGINKTRNIDTGNVVMASKFMMTIILLPEAFWNVNV